MDLHSTPPQSGSNRAGSRGEGGCHLPPKQGSRRRKETCPPHLAATPRVAGAEAQQIVTKKRTDNGRFRGRNRASRAGRATVAERPQLGTEACDLTLNSRSRHAPTTTSPRGHRPEHHDLGAPRHRLPQPPALSSSPPSRRSSGTAEERETRAHRRPVPSRRLLHAARAAPLSTPFLQAGSEVVVGSRPREDVSRERPWWPPRDLIRRWGHRSEDGRFSRQRPP
jgi:hypothetical protein